MYVYVRCAWEINKIHTVHYLCNYVYYYAVAILIGLVDVRTQGPQCHGTDGYYIESYKRKHSDRI